MCSVILWIRPGTKWHREWTGDTRALLCCQIYQLISLWTWCSISDCNENLETTENTGWTSRNSGYGEVIETDHKDHWTHKYIHTSFHSMTLDWYYRWERGYSVYGDSPGQKLEWVAMPSPRRSSQPGIKPIFLRSPALARGFFSTSTTWEAHRRYMCCAKSLQLCLILQPYGLYPIRLLCPRSPGKNTGVG